MTLTFEQALIEFETAQSDSLLTRDQKLEFAYSALDILINDTSLDTEQKKASLEALVGKASVYDTGSVTVLYSGTVAKIDEVGITGGQITEAMSGNEDIRTIKNTLAYELLNSTDLKWAVADAYGIDPLEIVRDRAVGCGEVRTA